MTEAKDRDRLAEILSDYCIKHSLIPTRIGLRPTKNMNYQIKFACRKVANTVTKDRLYKLLNQYDKKNRTNQELLADIDAYYKKIRDEETFNHPDYQHVHGNGYDPHK